MAGVDTDYTFKGDVARCFKAIRQYDKYPKYLPGVMKVDILPPQAEGSICQVRYELNIVKTFFYTLNMYEEEPHKIYWNLEESNLMKKNDGAWSFKASGKDKTVAHYTLEVAFKGLVPGPIVNKVTEASLPTMFAGFQTMITELG